MNVPLRPSDEVTDTRLLRKTVATFATGVTVVTVGGGTPHAMTANAFTSVSLDPPLVLVCVDRNAVMHVSLGTSDIFGISVLSGEQEAVARHFADSRRELGAAQFDGVDWLPGRLTGVPLIDDALANFECEVWRSYDGGDHTIFIGRLLSVDRGPAEDALLFFGGRFRRLIPEGSQVGT